jgi:hypothetical protein
MLPDIQVDLERLRTSIEECRGAVHVDLHGARSRLSTSDPRARRAVHYVFGRQADVEDVAVSDGEAWRVGCIRSDALCREWSKRCEAATVSGVEPIEVRRWDGDPVALRTDWPGHVAVIRHRTPFNGVTVFAEPLRTAAYILPEGEPLSIHHLEHLCKYTLRVQLWRAGGVEAHAATTVYRDRGIVMMGVRRSGKTTLQMHLLSHGGYMMGCDLTQLWPVGEEVEIRAIPAITRISAETIEDNAFLRESMTRARTGDDYLEGPVFFDEKYELYAPTLDSVFGRPVNVGRHRADLIVLPRFSTDQTRQRVTWLPTEAASGLVRDRLVNDKPLPDWLPFSEVPHRSVIEAGPIDGLMARLPPVAQLEFGREDTLDWSEIDRMVDGCAPQAGGTR